MSECDGCGGACCRCVVVAIGEMTPDQRQWAEMRGPLTVASNGGLSWRLPVACRHLTASGRCGIYETRPDVCRQFEAGGKLCEAAREHQKESGNGKA